MGEKLIIFVLHGRGNNLLLHGRELHKKRAFFKLLLHGRGESIIRVALWEGKYKGPWAIPREKIIFFCSSSMGTKN